MAPYELCKQSKGLLVVCRSVYIAGARVGDEQRARGEGLGEAAKPTECRSEVRWLARRRAVGHIKACIGAISERAEHGELAVGRRSVPAVAILSRQRARNTKRRRQCAQRHQPRW
eukprot:CAMPEP_0184404212 /NCGR_PEP_ID=MMETSP0007-20130409/85820_1 /TAXON_ID=97485 /ORGANISM="Prymnesium parvum, Strain Texoma1" /LENGTH=114 /DNA_ID=CAMNT_0026760355 /DNA_START=212 /DNA_END=553 /DNA_ORIENTATION=+